MGRPLHREHRRAEESAKGLSRAGTGREWRPQSAGAATGGALSDQPRTEPQQHMEWQPAGPAEQEEREPEAKRPRLAVEHKQDDRCKERAVVTGTESNMRLVT